MKKVMAPHSSGTGSAKTGVYDVFLTPTNCLWQPGVYIPIIYTRPIERIQKTQADPPKTVFWYLKPIKNQIVRLESENIRFGLRNREFDTKHIELGSQTWGWMAIWHFGCFGFFYVFDCVFDVFGFFHVFLSHCLFYQPVIMDTIITFKSNFRSIYNLQLKKFQKNFGVEN